MPNAGANNFQWRTITHSQSFQVHTRADRAIGGLAKFDRWPLHVLELHQACRPSSRACPVVIQHTSNAVVTGTGTRQHRGNLFYGSIGNALLHAKCLDCTGAHDLIPVGVPSSPTTVVGYFGCSQFLHKTLCLLPMKCVPHKTQQFM